MGISLSNKDYIAFTIKKKKERKEKRHDYDATADYNKTIIKEPRKREKRGGGEENETMARVLLTRPPQNDYTRKANGGADVPGVYAVRTLINRLDRY